MFSVTDRLFEDFMHIPKGTNDAPAADIHRLLSLPVLHVPIHPFLEILQLFGQEATLIVLHWGRL